MIWGFALYTRYNVYFWNGMKNSSCSVSCDGFVYAYDYDGFFLFFKFKIDFLSSMICKIIIEQNFKPWIQLLSKIWINNLFRTWINKNSSWFNSKNWIKCNIKWNSTRFLILINSNSYWFKYETHCWFRSLIKVRFKAQIFFSVYLQYII